MKMYPDEYFDKIEDITLEYLNEHEIKALILDSDNTVIDIEKKVPSHIKEWCEDLKSKGIIFYLLTNTNDVDKATKAATQLDVPFSYFATKPFKRGFKKAIRFLKEEKGIEKQNIAAVGDQIFTDIIGANRSGIYSILVKQLDPRDLGITAWKRPI